MIDDVSPTMVALELSEKYGKFAIEPLERGWVVDGNIEKFDEVAEALRRLVRKAGTRTKRAALALPGSAVITRKISLPAELDEDQLEIQVEAEAAQLIPFPLTDVALDFCVIGPSSTAAGYQEVLVAAARKEKVNDRQGVAEAAGLQPVIVDVEPYASRLAATRATALWLIASQRTAATAAIPHGMMTQSAVSAWSSPRYFAATPKTTLNAAMIPMIDLNMLAIPLSGPWCRGR